MKNTTMPMAKNKTAKTKRMNRFRGGGGASSSWWPGGGRNISIPLFKCALELVAIVAGGGFACRAGARI